MKQNAIQPVTVKILGKEYRIACNHDEKDGLLNAADLLHNKMKEVRDSGVVGQEKIAIMAALNLTHEILNEQNNRPSLNNEQLNSVDDLNSRIEKLLTPTET